MPTASILTEQVGVKEVLFGSVAMIMAAEPGPAGGGHCVPEGGQGVVGEPQVGVVRFGAAQSRRRRHNAKPRRRWVTVRLSDEEYGTVLANAAAARLAVAAYLAEAGTAPMVPASDSTDGNVDAGPLLVELMGVHRQVRGAAHNLNQAVARLHSTGEPAGDLTASAAYLARVAARVDDLVTAIAAAQTGRR